MNKLSGLVSPPEEQQDFNFTPQILDVCLFSTFLFVHLFTSGFSPQAAFFSKSEK